MEGRTTVCPSRAVVTTTRHCSSCSGQIARQPIKQRYALILKARWHAWRTARRLASLASSAPSRLEGASASTYDVELQRLLLAGPPPDFDFRAEVTPATRLWVDEHAPELRDLVNDGTLVVVPRRPYYAERRTDGYCEPEVVLLVGTAHVSRRSQQDVTRVVRAVAPDSVVVELCKGRSAALAAPSGANTPAPIGTIAPVGPGSGSRFASGSQAGSGFGPGATSSLAWTSRPSLKSVEAPDPVAPSGSGSDSDTGEPSNDSVYSDRIGGGAGPGESGQALAPSPYINPMNLAGGAVAGGGGGGSFLGAVARSVSLGGQSALLLRVLLAGLARRTAGSLGVTGGGEFAAAQAAAEEVGAQVVLGDRPLEITLSRAWAALPLRRRVALCGELLRGALATPREPLSEELVERLKGDDTVGAFFKQLSTSYPELVGPLITERDLYLAWSLKRSKAVDGARRVVGVVGRGHLRGVVHALLRDQGGAGLRFTDLVDGRNSRSRRMAQAAQGAVRLSVELALGGAAYLLWLAMTGHEQ